jgi:hypothetical protein
MHDMYLDFYVSKSPLRIARESQLDKRRKRREDTAWTNLTNIGNSLRQDMDRH